MGLLVNIDNGGTLTDICAFDGEKIVHAKTLTTPHDLTECLIEGLRLLGEKLDLDGGLQGLVSQIEHLRYSTTHGTNAIVQRKGPRLGLMCTSEAQAEALAHHSAELFENLVGNRVYEVGEKSGQSLVHGARDLVARGAERLLVCLDGDDAREREIAIRRELYAAFPRHLLGAVPLLFSTDLAARANAERRGWSGLVNAFLHPSMEHFLYNAEEKLRRTRSRNPMLVFRNDGGSTRVSRTIAVDTYSSGPRGGAEGASALARHYGIETMVSIDIGGTTTDLACFQDGAVAESRYGTVEGVPLAFPMAEVFSIAAGGGSILQVANGEVTVGPESVGSLPGPACFGRGGTHATITDVMLLAGLLDPASFFSGRMQLDAERAGKAVDTHLAEPLGLSRDAAIETAIAAYDEKVAAAIRKAGCDNDTVLCAFGGAGPMSACGIAERAGIRKVLIPRYAAVFSAFGIGFSPVRHRHEAPVGSFSAETVQQAREAIEARAARAMASEGFDLADCQVTLKAVVGDGEETRELEPADVPVGTAGQLVLHAVRAIPTLALGPARAERETAAQSAGSRKAFGTMPLYRLEDLVPGDTANGPCLIEEAFFTTWVRAGWTASVTGNHDLLLECEGE